MSTRDRPIGRIFEHLSVHTSVLQKRTNLIKLIKLTPCGRKTSVDTYFVQVKITIPYLMYWVATNSNTGELA